MKTRWCFIFLTVFIFLNNLNAQPHRIRCLKIDFCFPYGVDSNKVYQNDTIYARRYAMDSLVMIEKSYYIINEDETTKQVSRKEEHIYFLYKQGDTVGFNSKSPTTLFQEKMRVDSFINESGLDAANRGMQPFLHLGDMTPVYSKLNSTGDSLEEAYHIVARASPSNSLESIFYYKKNMNDEGLSLSDSLNKAKQMHVYSLKLIINAGYEKGLWHNAFYVQNSISEEVLSAADEEKIRKLFARYNTLTGK